MIYPEVLIISNKFDFSTDLITNSLKIAGGSYLRLNRDQLGEYVINFNPIIPLIQIQIDDLEYEINERALRSIYYRAPTFLREIVQEHLDEEEQLFRTQWAAFIRALVVFENVKWINNPLDTYKAEIKALQLKYAKEVGFLCPETSITNLTKHSPNKKIAIKSIDTAIISNNGHEAFVYTTIIDGGELQDHHYSSPFFIQQALSPKIDLRITVVGNEVITVKIGSEEGIHIDWRKYEKEIIYELYSLPDEIKQKCLKFARRFNLVFAAIDMVIYNSDYYFIEVNPTGEWAWLQKNTGFQFDDLIAKKLQHEDMG